jgi:hypothetical protein
MSTVCNLAVVNNWDPASKSSSGPLEVFATPTEVLGASVPLLHIWQSPVNGAWGTWQSLGGQFSAAGEVGSNTVAVAQNADGRLEAFGVDKHGTVFHIWQTLPSGGWSEWEYLGSGHQLGSLTLTQRFRLPRANGAGVGQNKDGRLELFGVDFNGSVVHIWQTLPGGGWSEWASLGSGYGPIAVGQNADGRLEVFSWDGHGTVRHIWQTVPGGGWSEWEYLGSGGYPAAQIAVGQNADGRLEAFGHTAHGSVFHIWQTVPNGGWSEWEYLGSGGNQVVQIAVGQNADGRLEVFGITANGIPLHIWQTVPGGGWSEWEGLGGDHQATKMAVGQNHDGRLEVFDISAHGSVFHIWQTVPNGGWSEWDTL